MKEGLAPRDSSSKHYSRYMLSDPGLLFSLRGQLFVVFQNLVDAQQSWLVPVFHGIAGRASISDKPYRMFGFMRVLYTYYMIWYIYTYIYIFRGLTFARNRRKIIWDCNLLCCFGTSFFLQTVNKQNIDIACISLHFCSYLRRCQNHFLFFNICYVICNFWSLKQTKS